MSRMEIRWDDERQPSISDIKAKVEHGKVTLNFKWPNELENLYIYKQSLMNGEEIDWDKPYRKYTKNEYASFGGFVDQAEGCAVSRYILCPYIQDDFERYIIDYKDDRNEIKVISQQIQIGYEIQEKKKLFSTRKLVQMHVFCELPLPQDYLCYVKKKGSIPVGPEDGMRFEFISDFMAGDNVLPEIEVDKDEYVRIYLTDEVPYKEVYRIVKN